MKDLIGDPAPTVDDSLEHWDGEERRNPSGERREIVALQSEVAALQSIVYGLCVSLSQMSEVHREVVVQAFDHAFHSPMIAALRGDEFFSCGAGASSDAISRIKDLTVGRIRASF